MPFFSAAEECECSSLVEHNLLNIVALLKSKDDHSEFSTATCTGVL